MAYWYSGSLHIPNDNYALEDLMCSIVRDEDSEVGTTGLFPTTGTTQHSTAQHSTASGHGWVMGLLLTMPRCTHVCMH